MTDAKEALGSDAARGLSRERYPWHANTWSTLMRDLSRLPHALLLHGAEGLGKRAFAWRMAESLLCAQPGTEAAACGACVNCQRISAGTHPDLLYVRPREESLVISVDQIREMREFVALKPHTAARKLVLLEPTEAMNMNAANALLKVLEEPPSSSLLLLVTSRLARVPATVRSRCGLLPFRPPPEEETAAWLRQRGVTTDASLLLRHAGRAPLRALALVRSTDLANWDRLAEDLAALRTGAEDPLRCAARWKDFGTEQCLEWLQRHVAETIRAAMAPGSAPNSDEKRLLRIKDLFRYFDLVSEARALLAGPLDQSLLLEDALIGWVRLFRPMV